MKDMNIAQTVCDHWMELRANGRLDEVLPPARTWKKTYGGHEVHGYDTCEHQVNRRVSIPGSGPNGGNSIADLVETYFSIRYHNGWGHNLHVHVVEIKNETLQLAHFAQLFRHLAGLRIGLQEHRILECHEGEPWRHRHLYIHGALLGPSASADVVMAEAMLDATLNDGSTQSLIRVGYVSVHPITGISIKRVEPEQNYSASWRDNTAEMQRLGDTIDDLLGSSPMWAEWTRAFGEERDGLHVRARRDSLFGCLAQAGFSLAEDDRARILACEEIETLDRWSRNISEAETIEEVFS
jgi:hypothetical protein